MAISLTSLPKFIKCTEAAYTALTAKDENALYFLTDKHVFYVGTQQYSFDIVSSDDTPTGTGLSGTIYYNTATGTASLWNGTEYVTLGMPTSTDLSGTVGDSTVPTSQATKNYVDITCNTLKSTLDSTYVKTETGKSLISDTEAAKLTGYPQYTDVQTTISKKVDKFAGTANNLVISSDTNGTLADAGVAVCATITASSELLPTNSAVKTYVDDNITAAKSYADSLITTLGSYLTFKGSVATYDKLPTNAKVGHLYHITDTGAEYLWDGSAWQEMGTSINLTTYIEKKSNVTTNNIVKFDANGDIADSGVAVGTTYTDDDSTVLTSKAVMSLLTSQLSAASDLKLDKLSSATANNIVTVGDDFKSVKDSGKKVVTEITSAATDDEVPTALATKTYADSLSQSAAGACLPFITNGVAGNIPLIADGGNKLSDSSKKIVSTITTSSTADDSNVPTVAAVKSHVNTKITKVSSATAGNIAALTGEGEITDSKISIDTATASFTNTASAAKVPNEAAVVAALQEIVNYISWQSL